jgi:hypothetical protein
LSVWMLVGCHNQTSSFSNPFMPPDRVPPPSTQPLTPGTAQPYYPGGPVQPAPPVAGQPTVPSGTFFTAPPATGGQAPPLVPTTPTAPPSGWNRSPQPVPGSATRAPVYGGQPTSAYTPSPPVTNPAAVSPAAVSNPSPQVPGQTILPAQYQAPPPYANMAATPGSPAGTVVQGTEPQRPVVRQLTAAELQSIPGAGTLAVGANGAMETDGFRPQGSASVASGSTIATQPITR